MKTPDNGFKKTWSRREFIGTTLAVSMALAASRAVTRSRWNCRRAAHRPSRASLTI